MPDPDRLHSILERLDGLPTPSPLAMRLLAVAHDDTSDARDLSAIIREDTALVAKVLSLCRRGPRGRMLDVASLERAVVLLGFGAVRSAALAVEFVGALGCGETAGSGFDPARYWRHALAKAVVADAIAKLVPSAAAGGRAFTIGLLHDLGALALSRAAPAMFDRACDEAERLQSSLDDACSAIIGISATTAALRLAARWRLPEELQACLGARGELALVAEGPHRTLAQVAELADRVVRRRHLGGAGFGPHGCEVEPVVAALGLDGSRLAALSEGLFEEVASRAEALGIASITPAALAAEAIERANRRMDLLARGDGVGGMAGSHGDALDAAGDVGGTLGVIARHIAKLSGRPGRLLIVSAPVEDGRCELREFAPDGSLVASRVAGGGDPDGVLAVRHWCALRAPQGRPGKLALLVRGATMATIHRAEGEVLPTAALATAPTSLWSFAIAAALERERSRRHLERATESARTVQALRDRLERSRVAACVGEVANGLAHELNNPLCVVAGRAHLLKRELGSESHPQIDLIIAAAERASGIVSDLLRAVRPGQAKPVAVSASEIIATAVRLLPCTEDGARVDVRMPGSQAAAVTCVADPAQVADALAEVLQNALQAAPGIRVELSAQINPGDGRCMIAVRDAGSGFSELALRHALDPFFSERPAGRGEGLGLTKARALVEASGGALELTNGEAGGAIVRITLPVDTPGRADGRGETRGTADRLPKAA